MAYWFDQGGDPLAAYYPQTEESYGMPRGSIGGIVAAENSSPSAISPAGARTQFQIIPSTARDLGVNLNDSHSAMQGAAKYWKQQLDSFGDPGLAYAAYNAGPGTVQKYLRGQAPLPAETQSYVRRALAYSGLHSDHFGSADEASRNEAASATDQAVPPPRTDEDQQPLEPPNPILPAKPVAAATAADPLKTVPTDKTYNLIMAALKGFGSMLNG